MKVNLFKCMRGHAGVGRWGGTGVVQPHYFRRKPVFGKLDVEWCARMGWKPATPNGGRRIFWLSTDRFVSEMTGFEQKNETSEVYDPFLNADDLGWWDFICGLEDLEVDGFTSAALVLATFHFSLR